MHQPDITPRSSVFYDYKIYPFRRPAEMDDHQDKHPVTIIGAGPAGLVLALHLARHNISSVIIESEAQVSHGSRAIVLTRRSMEILHQAGLSGPFVDKGLQWQYGRSFYKETEVYKMVMPYDGNDRFMPGLNIQQQYIEEFLVNAAEESPLIDLRWQTRFKSLKQRDNGVTLTLDSPAGTYDLETAWCVACDGGRSAVRKSLGLRMEGNAYPGNFVIADILAPVDLPTERLCYFDPDWNPGNNVLVHRQPDGLWRLDYRLPDGESPEQALAENLLAERIDHILAMIGQPVDWQLDWATVYSANALTLPDYRHGNTLFCGDAAHVLPIFGVRGANTGLQDAQNLAWKLALTLKRDGGMALIDSYSDERVAAAREICDEAGRSTRFMSPPGPGYRLLRDAVLSFSLGEDFARDFMHWRTSRPHEYQNSPLNADNDDNTEIDGGIINGASLRDIRLADDAFFLDYITTDFHLLVFADDTPSAAQDALLNLHAVSGVTVKTVLIGGESTNADINLNDPDNRIAFSMGVTPGHVCLIRPDQHVCGRWHQPKPEQVVAAIAAILSITNKQ